MQKEQKITLTQFIEKFPEVELPITLTEDMVRDFSQNNDPFPSIMIQQYIEPMEMEELDEFTEYIPCIRIPETHDFHAVIYWKGALMNYQYIMATFSKKGELIDRRVIGGTYSDGQLLVKSVVTIEDDWIIYVVSGKTTIDAPTYDASTSNTFSLELLATGQIIDSD